MLRLLQVSVQREVQSSDIRSCRVKRCVYLNIFVLRGVNIIIPFESAE